MRKRGKSKGFLGIAFMFLIVMGVVFLFSAGFVSAVDNGCGEGEPLPAIDCCKNVKIIGGLDFKIEEQDHNKEALEKNKAALAGKINDVIKQKNLNPNSKI